MKKLILFPLLALILDIQAQTFTNSTAQMGQTFYSGGCTGVVDMDGDGLDDMLVLHQSRFLRIGYQEANGTYTWFDYGSVSNSSQWGMCAGDVNNDGHKDIISGASGDGVHFVNITSRGNSSLVNLNNSSMFLQGCNFADIDNDGWLDAFGCHDNAASRIWQNDQNGSLLFTTNLIDLTDYALGVNTDHSGNYGSVWSDFDDDGDIDLLIAKCRQGINNVNDPRRINQLWVNDGNGNYTEDALAHGLVLYDQSWTGDFGDYDNDGDFDCLITTHTSTLKLLQNDGNNNFTDVTAAAGVGDQAFFLQAKMVDLDNDGFLDIIYSGGSHAYFHNDGDGTFTRFTNKFPYADVMHSFGIGDLNDDGFLDVYASYGNSYVTPSSTNPDQLWLNDGNNNNWISFDLTGFLSNLDAVGAKVKIFGPWGVQTREIRAGESYGITTTFKCHFGIGTETAVDYVEIAWPSGLVTTIQNPEINMVNDVLEAPCQVNGVTISPENPPMLCEGGTVTLTAPAGFESYTWTGGFSGESIEVGAAGNYAVTVVDPNGCLGLSNFVTIEVFESTPPVISMNGPDTFCSNLSAELTSSEGVSYLWSNGSTDAVIQVNQSGDYSVQVTDQCDVTQLSNVINITVLASGDDPMVDDEVLAAPGQATFMGNSVNLKWFDDPMSDTPVGNGLTFTTPVLNNTTSYWVQEVPVYDGLEASGGKLSTGTGQYHTNSQNWQLFDAHEDIILKQVRVFANGAGNRTIQVIDSQGNEVAVGTFNIPNGSSYVTLNFNIPEGSGYGIRTLDNNPQLWRDAPPTALSYPYQIGGLATITSSSIIGANALQYYYFFYDWQVETQSYSCPGEKFEVVAYVAENGCTDVNACNYNPVAGVDDGSCDYSCFDCPADFTGNGIVGTEDLLLLLSEYGCAPPDACTTDLNGDGFVNSNDLLFFLASYGTDCP